jgi:hypothetical protein
MRVRNESGFVLPTRLLALCVSAVAMAALVYIANDPEGTPAPEATTAKNPAAAASQTPSSHASSSTSTKAAKPKPKKPKVFNRGKVEVMVYNNTHVTGLAGGVASKASAAGWNVVGADNWWGSFDGSAVYYPPKMKDAAQLLAKDLGIPRVKPAQDPMSLTRLTVVLTDDYA